MKLLQTKMSSWTKESSDFRSLAKAIKFTGLFFLFAFSSVGQDLSVFKKCALGSGIDAIPYPTLEKKASDLQSAKDKAFDACKGYKGRALHDSKKNSLRIKKEMTEDLVEAEKKVADYKGSSSSELNSLNSKVKELKKELADVTEEIAEFDKKINEGLKLWQKLLDIRFEIDQVYSEVKKQLLQSKSSPDDHIKKPSSSDKVAMDQYNKDVTELKGYIDKIVGTVDKGRSEHKKPIDEAVNVIEWLENAQDLK